jgi:thiamine pyridinylase
MGGGRRVRRVNSATVSLAATAAAVTDSESRQRVGATRRNRNGVQSVVPPALGRFAMRVRKLILLVAIFVTAAARFPVQAQERYCSDGNARVLRVEMYPFVPGADGIALKIKELFEAGCPGLDLQIRMNPNYYATDDSGILAADADIYEIDSVFFDDFVKHRNPKPPSQFVLDMAGPVVPFAKDIVTSGGTQFGIPHWICTEFLIFKKALPQIGAIKGPADAARVFGELAKGPLMDLKGPTTLGELYLSVLVAHYGSAGEALEHLDPDHLDDYAVAVLRGFINMEPPGFGRDQDYHLRDGFYARQFVRGSGSAFVGYSEDTYYALRETAQSCLKDECLGRDDLDVALWPFADEGAKPVAWVDMYMMDSRLTDAKLRDAEAFIKFMMSVSTYGALLLPPDGAPNGAPKYLLPARDDVYSSGKMSSDPLYPKFRNLIGPAVPVTEEGLNHKLHQVAAALEKVLPADH